MVRKKPKHFNTGTQAAVLRKKNQNFNNLLMFVSIWKPKRDLEIICSYQKTNSGYSVLHR